LKVEEEEMTTIRKTYTTEFKVKVVREILREEKSLSQIASEYRTHTNVISRWRDQALAGLPALFDDRAAQEKAAKEAEWEQEREGLYAEIGRLSTQLGWLKKKGGRLFELSLPRFGRVSKAEVYSTKPGKELAWQRFKKPTRENSKRKLSDWSRPVASPSHKLPVS
jgi:transposase